MNLEDRALDEALAGKLGTNFEAIHEELSRIKRQLQIIIRAAFNPEIHWGRLFYVGAVVLRTGAQMIITAGRSIGVSDDELYQEIHGFIDAWRQNDAEDGAAAAAEKAATEVTDILNKEGK